MSGIASHYMVWPAVRHYHTLYGHIAKESARRVHFCPLIYVSLTPFIHTICRFGVALSSSDVLAITPTHTHSQAPLSVHHCLLSTSSSSSTATTVVVTASLLTQKGPRSVAVIQFGRALKCHILMGSECTPPLP